MATTPLLQWTPFQESEFKGAEIASIAVPLCHTDLCSDTNVSSATLELRVLRCLSPARDNGSTPTLFAVSDMSLDANDNGVVKTWCSEKREANAAFYALETRLARLSTEWSPTPDNGLPRPLSIDALQFFEQRLGVGRLEALSITAAALDLARVLPLVLAADTKAYVLGYASGTRVVQRFLQLESAWELRDRVVQGYVLAAPMAMALRDRDTRFAAVADRWLTQCSTKGKCMSQRPTAYTAAFDMLDGESEGTNCAHFIRQTLPRWLHERRASFALRFYLAALLAHPEIVSNARPVDVPGGIVDAISRCDDRDFMALTRWLAETTAAVGVDRLKFKADSSAVHHFVQLTELWPQPSPTQNELDKLVASTRVTDGFLAAQLTPHCELLPSENATACADARPHVAGVESHVRPRLRSISYKRPSLRMDAPMDLGAQTNVLVLADPGHFGADAQYADELYRSRLAPQPPLRSKVNNIVIIRSRLDRDWPLFRARDAAAVSHFIRMDARALRGVWDIDRMEFLDKNERWTQDKLEWAATSLTRMPIDDSGNDAAAAWSGLYPQRYALSTAQLVVLVVAIAISLVLIEMALTIRHNRRVRQRAAREQAEEEQPLATAARQRN
ncbi:hypothetical protein ATCC90586_002694 [Pythium insidiosum]|nr:hypothetical protein ATCC90586_002694 [Pythium insidiosum]